MPKLHIIALHTEDPGMETASATRDRLKASFPPGSIRRMTQLGLLVGHCLGRVTPLAPEEATALVYASRYAESRALEDFLASFPEASPTLFQTSIHPSGAQQGLIARRRPISSFFPLPGGRHVPGLALLTAALCPEDRILLCGGEERGSWLTELLSASDRSFAFALMLAPMRTEGTAAAQAPAIAEISLVRDDSAEAIKEELTLVSFFEHLHQRRPYEGVSSPGWRLRLEWL